MTSPCRGPRWRLAHGVLLAFHGGLVLSSADDLRAVFDLLWYQGLTQAEAAALLLLQKKFNALWEDEVK